MKRTQILATLAFAFMLGAAVPFIELARSACVSAAELEAANSTRQEPSTITAAEAPSALEEISTPLTSEPAEPVNDTTTSAAGEVIIRSQSDLATLRTAVNNPDVSKVTLATDLVISDALGGKLKIRRYSNTPFELNLNGHTISSADDMAVKYTLYVRQSNLHITGGGSIIGKSALQVVGDPNKPTSSDYQYTTVTIDDGVVLQGIDSTNGYGIAILNAKAQQQAYGVNITLSGQIQASFGMSVYGEIQDAFNAPQITIGDTARIDSVGASIYAAGYAHWNIGAAQITGNMGLGVKAGTLTLNGTTITATGQPTVPNPAVSTIEENGVAFALEHNNSYADDIVLNINGGNYTSQNTSVFYEYSDADLARAATRLADINITAGKFTAGGNAPVFGGSMTDTDIEISGGTFTGRDVQTDQFKNYLAAGLAVDANGQIIDPSTPPVTPGRPNRPSGSTSSPEAPEDPSDSEEPSDPTPEQKPSNDQNTAPDTGLNHGRGALTAASTVIPVLCGAIGVIFMVCAQKVFARRKALNEAEVEMEIDEQIAEIVDEPEEPVIERFVAEAIEREEPKVTPVDTFILQK